MFRLDLDPITSIDPPQATLEMDGEAFFSARRITELHLSDAELAAYAGGYRSAELDATYYLSIDKGSLMLRNNPADEPAMADYISKIGRRMKITSRDGEPSQALINKAFAATPKSRKYAKVVSAAFGVAYEPYRCLSCP
jgi:hypothetical protein